MEGDSALLEIDGPSAELEPLNVVFGEEGSSGTSLKLLTVVRVST